MATLPEASPRVVIVGGGVIGASTAYFLSLEGIPSLCIEKKRVACAASGKAGGFLAREWAQDTPNAELMQLSFDLHTQLAERHNGSERWGYRRVDTFSLRSKIGTFKKSSFIQSQPWLSEGTAISCEPIGNVDNTAQVHPRLFTQSLLEEATLNGASLMIAEVCGIIRVNGRVKGVRIRRHDSNVEESVEADVVVLAMGPWFSASQAWLSDIRLPSVRGEKAQSIVFPRQSYVQIPAQALFVTHQSRGGGELEVYPRPDGTMYVCGYCANDWDSGGEEMDADNHSATSEEVLSLTAKATDLLPFLTQDLSTDQHIQTQACYLPTLRQGRGPVIGPVPGVQGLFVATGHSCWGILYSTGTGLALAEAIARGRVTSLNMDAFACP